MSQDFYKNLPSFKEFKKLSDMSLYQEVPGDWWVIISDVVQSTVAIQEGRYRDVNLIGASAVASIKEVLSVVEIPFVFGGDGTSMVVPPNFRDQVLAQLYGLADFSSKQFNLQLRVGCVEVSQVRDLGSPVKVAKFGLLPNRALAVFQGGGLSLAESLIKGDPDRYHPEVEGVEEPDLNSISCRWQPIQALKGKVVSLLVLAKTQDSAKVYLNVMNEIQKIIGGDLELANPVNSEGLKYNKLSYLFKNERKFRKSFWSKRNFDRIWMIIMAFAIFSLGFYRRFDGLKQYHQDLNSHSDYRKFDDVLRLVIDLTTKQHEVLVHYLEQERQNQNLYYGLHLADEAIMTCLFDGVGEGNHLHFIDGGDGGYAIAALQLKKQIQEAVFAET